MHVGQVEADGAKATWMCRRATYCRLLVFGARQFCPLSILALLHRWTYTSGGLVEPGVFVNLHWKFVPPNQIPL
jgi:hypothetical protein